MKAQPGNGNRLLVGASGGIGQALAAAQLEQTDVRRLIATYRSEPVSPGLADLARRHEGRLVLQRLDATDGESLAALADVLSALDGGIDLAIHAAGILHEGPLTPEKSLQDCDPAGLLRQFQVNAIGPLMVARTLLPLQPRQKRFGFAALSAMVGSIGDNRLGGWYGYRASKAALNQFVKTLANECRIRFPQATIVAIHPGTTDTPLSKPYQGNIKPGKLYTPEQSARRILDVLADAGPQDSGSFFNWDGSRIPW
jgi:NAD(P)-dependent dehydrogenase (short-subunit alcohol dehydrogenase family)